MLCPSCNTPNRDDAKFCKKCGQSFRVESTQVPEVATVSQVSTPVQEHMDADDPSFAPTQIISPQKMLEFHNRRWQQESEREQTTATEKNHATASNEEDIPTQLSTSAPGASPAGDEAAPDIADMPTLLFNLSTDSDHVSIPPPPPPTSTDAATPAPMPEASTDESTPIPPPPPEIADAAAQPVELPEAETTETTEAAQTVETTEAAQTVETKQEQPAGAATEETKQEQTATTKKEENGVTQTPSDQLDQAPAAAFPVLAVGTIVHERYEVTQVISESVEEHIYSVTDHQGYQHCWNCNSEQNSEGDEFCIDCGAELLNAVYTMHEYTDSKKSDADANTFHGNIVDTFVEEGRTYAIEQVQAAENAFPTGVHLLAASDSDAGDVRRSEPNEDSTLVLMLQRVHESQAAPVGVFIVADGLGGHDNGQEASRMAINIIAERMVRELLATPLASEKVGETVEPTGEDSLVSLLQSTIEDANAAICQVNQRDKTDMGSTITGFMVVGDYAYILNVGDSRTYMVRGQQIYQLTTDHSLVAQLVAGGLIEPDDVYTHPQRSQIYRSLGDKLNVTVDIFKQQLHPGDILLGCSDGLWEMVRNPQIESILNNAPDPQTACTQLLEAANTNGGEDNVSAVVVFVR